MAGNFIGVGADGKRRIGGAAYGGILLRMGAVAQHDRRNQRSSTRNVISGNAWYGIWIGDAKQTRTSFRATTSGVDALGNPLANGQDGIFVSDGATGNLIGGTAHGARNVISANARDGIAMVGASENVIQGNYIGTGVTGTVALGNGRFGVSLSYGASDNVIGTDGDGLEDGLEGNLIVGNTTGVSLFSADTLGNSIRGNSIYCQRRSGHRPGRRRRDAQRCRRCRHRAEQSAELPGDLPRRLRTDDSRGRGLPRRRRYSGYA